jgi:transcriptional regulator with XRE-family HTH domain
MATTADDVDEIDNWTGRRVRELRKLHGLSAKELAARAGVTQAYVSRLETGKLSPTVATLTRLLHGMGESMERLFGAAESADPVVRRDQRRVVRSHGVDDELITAPSAQRLRVLETTVAVGAHSGRESYEHSGDEECIVVIEGSLRVWLEDTSYDLGPGDSITFSCGRRHRWANTGSVVTKALWIVTPADSGDVRSAQPGTAKS